MENPAAKKKSSEVEVSKKSDPELFKQHLALDVSVEKDTPVDASMIKSILQPEI